MRFFVLTYLTILLSLALAQGGLEGRIRADDIHDSFIAVHVEAGVSGIKLENDDEVKYASAHFRVLKFIETLNHLKSNVEFESDLFSPFLETLKKTEAACKSVLTDGPGFLNGRRKHCLKLLRKNKVKRIRAIQPLSINHMHNEEYSGYFTA